MLVLWSISVLMDFIARPGYNHVYSLFTMLFCLIGPVFTTQVVAPFFEDVPSKIPRQEQNPQFVRRMYHGSFVLDEMLYIDGGLETLLIGGVIESAIFQK